MVYFHKIINLLSNYSQFLLLQKIWGLQVLKENKGKSLQTP